MLLTLQAVARLCKRGCKLIVIACNSASAHALKALRERCSVPIVGLVPAVKPACTLTKSRQIAVLATQATLRGYLLKDVIDHVATPAGVMVHQHFEPTLVPWVENGMPIGSQVSTLLTKQVRLWADMGVDVIVLGCTHYPFFKGFLQEFLEKEGFDIHLIDSGFAIAQRVQHLLMFFGIKSPATVRQSLSLYATYLDDDLMASVSRLSGETQINVIKIDK